MIIAIDAIKMSINLFINIISAPHDANLPNYISKFTKKLKYL